MFFCFLFDKFPIFISASLGIGCFYSALSLCFCFAHVLFPCILVSSTQIFCSQNSDRNIYISSFLYEKQFYALCCRSLPQQEQLFYNTCSVALFFSCSKRIKFISRRIKVFRFSRISRVQRQCNTSGVLLSVCISSPYSFGFISHAFFCKHIIILIPAVLTAKLIIQRIKLHPALRAFSAVFAEQLFYQFDFSFSISIFVPLTYH